jgi:hypothetical protein
VIWQLLPEVFPLAIHLEALKSMKSANVFDGQPLTCETHSRPGQSQCGHMHQHLGRGRRAGLLAAKPELRYWAMPLGGFAKGDSQQQSHKRLSAEWATEYGASETIAGLSISSPRTGTPTRRFGLWQYMRPFCQMLDSGGQRRPTVPGAGHETTIARETREATPPNAQWAASC